MRQTLVNIELTSYCNRKCITCPQGNPDSGIHRQDMSMETLDVFLRRVEEARGEGLFIKEIINSGYGETFMHKKLDEAFSRYADFKRRFAKKWGHRPDISIVTNGSLITPENLDSVLRAVDILKFSFPTSNPEHYGMIMQRNAAEGRHLLDRAVESLTVCMERYRDGRLSELRVHLSPPCQQSFEDFDETMQFLTRLASRLHLDNIRIVIFPSTSNRAGEVSEEGFINNFYRAHQRRYAGKVLNGVKVVMLSEFNVFYPTYFHVVRVLADRFPCIWKGGSISINSVGGYRYCINDSESLYTLGSLDETSLVEVFRKLRLTDPSPGCSGCNQNPANMGDDPVQRLYRFAAGIRMKFS
ncbi:MAG: radical SAM protein [Planctomycetes bacterium]|nr:radical SAM protein [Planctomycetota bacterium]